MLRILPVLMALIAITSIACSPKLNPFDIYKPISVDRVYQLKRDSTTRKQVEQLFGAPLRTSINERGDYYTYAYFGDSLFIQFNNNGRINRFNYEPESFRIIDNNEERTSRNFPNRQLRKILPGETKRADLINMFGKPNRTERGTERTRTTFIGRNERLIVYSRLRDDLVTSHELARE